jgi:hypothetical protein
MTGHSEILNEVYGVYNGSNGAETAALYARLDAAGPAGRIATNLFRASKSSGRAKTYRRGPGHITAAYDRKQWALDNLAQLLTEHGAAVGIPPGTGWGWKEDPEEPHAKWVLYVELPELGPLGGQVSFHTPARGAGPDFAGEWDRLTGRSAARICLYCAAILSGGAPGGGAPGGGTGEYFTPRPIIDAIIRKIDALNAYDDAGTADLFGKVPRWPRRSA